MSMHTTVRSYTAIGVGCLFTAVTLFVLLDDVARHGAPLTIKHIVTCSVLFGTVYFGHRFWLEIRALRPGTTLGCAVLFLAGTLTCVLMSAGRNAEVITNKVLHANAANTDRIQALLDREEAKKRYTAALQAETLECGTGKGRKCEARRETTVLARADLDRYERAVRVAGDEQVANADIVAAASLVARLPGVTVDKATIEALLELAFPFLQSLFCELAAIVGFAIGFGHVRRPLVVVSSSQVSEVSTPATTAIPQLPAPLEKVSIPKPAKIKRVYPTDQQMVLDALDRLGGKAQSNDELAAAMGVLKGESSKRWPICEAEGLIATRRVGNRIEMTKLV